LAVDHTTIWRWVQRYAPVLNQRIRRELRRPNRSWRVDETYLKIAGTWAYLYRAVDSAGETIEFMLSPKRDLIAAKLFLRLALSGGGPPPRVINVDGRPAYPSAVAELQQSGELSCRCRCRTSPYLNNVIEQDHRFIKKRVTASLNFRSAEGACRTIEGYEATHAIRKGQIRWVPKGDPVGQRQFIHAIFGVAAQRLPGYTVGIHTPQLHVFATQPPRASGGRIHVPRAYGVGGRHPARGIAVQDGPRMSIIGHDRSRERRGMTRSGDSPFGQSGERVLSPQIGPDSQFQGRDSIEADLIVFDFAGRACRAKRPLLPDDFLDRPALHACPPNRELLRALDLGLHEPKMNPPYGRGLVEDDADSLLPLSESPPTSFIGRSESRFDGKVGVFRCYFDGCDVFEVEPGFWRCRSVLNRRLGHNPLSHTSILSRARNRAARRLSDGIGYTIAR
jgi:transposase-like protein